MSGTVEALNTSTALDATSEVLESATAIISGTLAHVFVKAGVHGYDYVITCLVTLSPGSPVPTLEDEVRMEVREL